MDSKDVVWISHSSITDFDRCLRLYYFKNIFRNPKTGNRVQVVNPYLSLGSAVHEAIEEMSSISPSGRAKVSLIKKYENAWKRYSGKSGGFFSTIQEREFKKRGAEMIRKVEKSHLFKRKSFKKGGELPKLDLFDNIKLVGSLDWIEILPDKSLHIIDFKTGKKEESKDSLQLPIYHLLAEKNYKGKIKKLSYWYLENNSKPTPKRMGNAEKSLSKIKKKSLEIKKAIKINDFSCSAGYNGRCYWCRTYEQIVSGRAEYVGLDDKMKKDLYFLINGSEIIRKIEESSFLSKIEKEILAMRLQNKTLEEVREEKRLAKKNIRNISLEIKRKLKENLTNKELKVFIAELRKNGKEFEF